MTGRVAIVDDDKSFTEYLDVFLRTRGYRTEVFHSGQALLDAMKTRAVPTVIVLDVTMPDLDGLDTLRALRAAQPATQVIMLSGRQAPATIVEAVRLGAADYVLKPGDAEGLGEAALESALRNAFEREALTNEVWRLSSSLPEDPDGTQPCWAIGSSMQSVMAMVERVADSDVSVLLRGESGAGKEVIARELHRRSARRAHPFIKVNCAALPADLLESELFGHERGAFTGAISTRIGKFEFAQHGTLMLDEIAEIPAALQAKLLHVLQDGQFSRLGGNRFVDADVRVIAATNRDLEAMMRNRMFREDLYYRLQVIEIHIPPLRERREEIPALAEFFLQKFARVYQRTPVHLSRQALDRFANYAWPGNIRELENMTKRFVVLQDESLIMAELLRAEQALQARMAADDSPAPRTQTETAIGRHAVEVVDLAPGLDLPPEAGKTVDLQALAKSAAMRAERDAIQAALERFRWNRRKTASYLNVSYKTLLNKMKESGIRD
jgi:DNA-binding NtrC family response regulator